MIKDFFTSFSAFVNGRICAFAQLVASHPLKLSRANGGIALKGFKQSKKDAITDQSKTISIYTCAFAQKALGTLA